MRAKEGRVVATERTPGRMVRCAAGYKAFVPDSLPPALTWSPRLVRALSAADRAIGQLSGEGRRLPNPHILIRPFVRREAVLSSRIEGTQATLGELLAAEAGGAVDRSPADLREVGNYVAALEQGVARLAQFPLSLDLVRQLHATLLSGVRGDEATPGEFRTSQNWIGPPGCTVLDASFVPPPPGELNKCLEDWESFLADRTLPPLVQIALLHYQFEAIHPFHDGNGRVGRLLITLLLVERGILPTPLLYLSAFFEATRREYYDRLRAVSEYGQWTDWLTYFLAGVSRQSEDALGRAERVNTLVGEWHRAVQSLPSKTPALLIDLLAENPFWTVARAADRLGVAYTTAQRAIEHLLARSIVERTSGARRNKVYCAKEILDILEEPASLKPNVS
jgi:Fic family protein